MLNVKAMLQNYKNRNEGKYHSDRAAEQIYIQCDILGSLLNYIKKPRKKAGHLYCECTSQCKKEYLTNMFFYKNN